MSNELSLLERLAFWLESQGATVLSTHFSYTKDEATISAVIDLSRTEVKEPVGMKDLNSLLMSAESAMRLDQRALPSTLEVVAKNMAKSVIRLKRLAMRRGPDYLFDLFLLLERERGNAVQEDKYAAGICDKEGSSRVKEPT